MSTRNLTPLSDDALEGVAGGFGEGGTISSGSFSSSTGTGLDIVVNWTVAADMAGNHELQAVVGTSSSNLSCSSIGNGVTLIVGGMTYTASSNAIDYHGSGTVYNTLASFVIPNVYGTINVTAIWRFNDVYYGNSIGEITASGVVYA
ncbi:MAG: hypothetical protein J5829_01425 [Lachnospiraceae bacterium]|nr:hypothetical protein [Lachnospiraceae bacterium]